MTRRRLDAELVRRGLVTSRAEAQEAVRRGSVLVSGSPATKAETMVGADEPVLLSVKDTPFVSRAGAKLAAALARFGVEPAGRDCLDAGASTGGFTDCLLQAGAASVLAVDVGYGQLAWSLRSDPRVEVRDRTNVRDLEPGDLPHLPEVVVVDLSFISLRLALPALARLAAPKAEFVLLVKPQFEAGSADVGRGGVVRDPDVWRRVVVQVAEVGAGLGLSPAGAMASPLRGRAGNVEFLLHLRRPGEPVALDLDALVSEGEAIRA